MAQQLREATPFGQRPTYLRRDNDCKYGPAFARVAAATGIEALRTAYRAPRQNATRERSLGSVRRECLDHVLVLGEAHLRHVLQGYVLALSATASEPMFACASAPKCQRSKLPFRRDVPLE